MYNRLSYIIEINSDFRLFVKQIKWKKSNRNAEIHLNGGPISYLVLVFTVFVYDVLKENINFNFLTILFWFIITIISVKIFLKYYTEYQGVDQNKADDDYSL